MSTYHTFLDKQKLNPQLFLMASVQSRNQTKIAYVTSTCLQTKVRELGKTALDAILHPNTNPTKEAHLDNNRDDESTDMETLPTVDLQNIDKTINELCDKIANLHPPPLKPSNHHLQQEQTPPANSNSAKHKQHPKQLPLQEVQNVDYVNKVVQQEPPPKPQQYTNGIIKWLFPLSICQTQVGGRAMASNACTIIASLWCRKFLLKTLAIPSNESDIRAITSTYKQTILTGNLLY